MAKKKDGVGKVVPRKKTFKPFKNNTAKTKKKPAK